MASEEALKSLLESSGSEFFDKLEEYLRSKIPPLIKNVLLSMDIDRSLILSTFDGDSTRHIEDYMKRDFTIDMVSNNQAPVDYLGKFVNSQKKFVLSYGHKLMINVIVETCRKLIANTTITDNVTSGSLTSAAVDNAVPSTASRDDQSNDYETIELPDNVDKENLKRYVGSLIITVFNDAKRLTLSGWSWPSRHVAVEKSCTYKVSGNPVCTPTLNYVTPSQHTQFLNCIVESDTKNLIDRIKNSLTLSLRVDGSVDRTQDHNIYVMANVVNKDATVSTIFIGFDVPKQGKSIGYFDCVKTVVGKILPWEMLLHLLSSIVTDGEELNLGPHSGLHVRILNEIRNLISSEKPLLLIWCLPHRVNLAWKDVCKECSIIAALIADSSSLSSFFHKSGERTMNLKKIATSKGLSKPLRYVTYFPVRWTEYVYDLLLVTLRNWRAAMANFVETQETPLMHRWLLHDRIHFMAFLTDVLQRFKAFQKTFESNTISILDVQTKRQKLFNELELCANSPVDNGWEQLFLSQVDELGDDGPLFFGLTLLKNCGRTSKQPTFEFNQDIRKSIIQSFICHLSERLDFDADLQANLEPLRVITSESTSEAVKLCHTTIAPDLDEIEFVADYEMAVNLLRHYEFKSPLETLQQLHTLRPNGLTTLKTALARLIAAKPHAADVERLICTYNKVKTIDRISLSGLSLYNFLYINTNMTNLDEFDPEDAVQHWMSQRKRRPAESQTRRQQEFFQGVFEEADMRKPVKNDIVSF